MENFTNTPTPLPQDSPSSDESPDEYWVKVVGAAVVSITLQALLIVAAFLLVVFIRRHKFGVRRNLVFL